VKSVDLYKNDSIDINVTVPIGLTPENLKELEKTLEFNFGGDININWDKYNGIVKIKINKDPNVKMESIRKNWSRILSDKNIRNKFKQYFEVTDVNINNNSQYILTIMTPITLSDESLLSFKSIIEQNLHEETIESFYSQSNDIFITISHSLKKDSV
jgi:F0F1-type ATP synthase delta subunit